MHMLEIRGGNVRSSEGAHCTEGYGKDWLEPRLRGYVKLQTRLGGAHPP